MGGSFSFPAMDRITDEQIESFVHNTQNPVLRSEWKKVQQQEASIRQNPSKSTVSSGNDSCMGCQRPFVEERLPYCFPCDESHRHCVLCGRCFVYLLALHRPEDRLQCPICHKASASVSRIIDALKQDCFRVRNNLPHTRISTRTEPNHMQCLTLLQGEHSSFPKSFVMFQPGTTEMDRQRRQMDLSKLRNITQDPVINARYVQAIPSLTDPVFLCYTMAENPPKPRFVV